LGFPVVFFLLGTLSSGSVIGNTNYLLEIAPLVDIPLYVAAMNTFMAGGAAFSLVAGKLIGTVGFQSVFVAAALVGAAAFAASGRLDEPRSGSGSRGESGQS
jgi:MFS family permease